MPTKPLQAAPWRTTTDNDQPALPRSVPQAFLRDVSEGIRTSQTLALCQLAMLILLSILVSLK